MATRFFNISRTAAVLLGGIAVLAFGCDKGEKNGARGESAAASFAEERALVERFAVLKNAGDAAADDLLGPAPAVPAEPVSEREAERLVAEFYLRHPLEILEVRNEKDQPRFVLRTKGSCESKTLAVRTAAGVDRVQRTAYCPDLVVEVREGKIRALEARLRRD